MELDKIKIRLAEIESTQQQHYAELNNLYVQVLELDSTFLDEYPLSYLMKFPGNGDYVIGALIYFYSEDTNVDTTDKIDISNMEFLVLADDKIERCRI